MKTIWRYGHARVPEGHLKKVCRWGAGAECCSYIALGGRSGFFCAKPFEDLREVIDARRADGTITAMGDYCQGPPTFKRLRKRKTTA